MARRQTGPGGRARAASKWSGPPGRGDPSVASESSQRGDASKSLKAAADETLAPGLYLVATPIGNAGDITLRALRVLAAADVIACEDTRVTSKLLAIHGISRRLVRYDEHSARTSGAALVRRLLGGERVALVSDAGTPLLSDPGDRLVRDCIDAGVAVVAIPGASAALAALCVAGLPVGRFLFVGFLPPRAMARRRELASLADVDASLVLLESPQRLAAALADMADVLGPRPAAVTRELTKLFEEVRRGPLDVLAARYAEAGPPKGEVTVVIGPPLPLPPVEAPEADRLLADALTRLSARDAASEVAHVTGLPRRGLYARAIAMKRGEP